MDLKTKRVISSRRAEALAARHGILYYETSARDNIGIDFVFESMATRIRRQQLEVSESRRFANGSPSNAAGFQLGTLDDDGDSLRAATLGCCGIGGSRRRTQSAQPPQSGAMKSQRSIHFAEKDASPLRKMKTGIALERLPSVSPTAHAVATKRTARLHYNSPMKSTRLPQAASVSTSAFSSKSGAKTTAASSGLRGSSSFGSTSSSDGAGVRSKRVSLRTQRPKRDSNETEETSASPRPPPRPSSKTHRPNMLSS